MDKEKKQLLDEQSLIDYCGNSVHNRILPIFLINDITVYSSSFGTFRKNSVVVAEGDIHFLVPEVNNSLNVKRHVFKYKLDKVEREFKGKKRFIWVYEGILFSPDDKEATLDSNGKPIFPDKEKFEWQTRIDHNYIHAAASEICIDICPDRKLKKIDLTNAQKTFV